MKDNKKMSLNIQLFAEENDKTARMKKFIQKNIPDVLNKGLDNSSFSFAATAQQYDDLKKANNI